MNKPLLLSLAAATMLSSSLDAKSMYERIQSMELQMKQMELEMNTLRSVKKEADAESEDEEEVDDTLDSEDSDEDDSKEESSGDDGDEDEDEDDDDEFNIEEEIADIQEIITELNKATNGNHLKFNVDYRFAIDNLSYVMADGSEAGNDALLTNRFWINMNWKATDNLSFAGQLSYNKAYGQRSGASMPQGNSAEAFDWITNENAYDDTIRLRSAYFLYKNDTFMGTDIPWTFSIGRRPSTNGHLVNLRDDDGAASPMGHTINVEFDGISSKFALEELTGVEGMYVKFCGGRGMTNAAPKFSATPYATDSTTNPDIDLAGLIFVPYDDGQYGLATQYYYANNLIDLNNPSDQTQGFDTVGGMHSFTANFTVSGIGDEWNDYLDDTFLFISAAMTQTDPIAGKSMLGDTESVTGTSIWAGLQMPSFFTEDGRWGFEYNQGSQYWRSITYGEDTNIGSKIGTRGSAYEAYFTEPLVDDILSFQVRYTYIDYQYSGSNGFFGSTTGTSMLIEDIQAGAAANNAQMIGMSQQVVDTAQDIRFYLRYRY